MATRAPKACPSTPSRRSPRRARSAGFETRNADGIPNLGPYSYFNAIGNTPNMVCFSSDGLKHSFVNARDRGAFTFSLATEALADAMNVSSEATPDDLTLLLWIIFHSRR